MIHQDRKVVGDDWLPVFGLGHIIQVLISVLCESTNLRYIWMPNEWCFGNLAQIQNSSQIMSCFMFIWELRTGNPKIRVQGRFMNNQFIFEN